MVHFNDNNLSVKVLPVKVPVPPSPVGIATLKRRTINPVAQLFIEHAREVAKPLAKKI
jgi:DNA-binding transcriptional LysR family regulator